MSGGPAWCSCAQLADRPVQRGVRSVQGRSAEELARQFEPSAQAIRNWAKQADRDEGKRLEGLTTLEQEELLVA
jgi:transposase-like protein